MGCGRRCSPASLSVLAYNFFFLPPLYTFTIADPENVVALFFFAVVAVIASNLTARVRAQAVAARQRARSDRGALSLQPQARRRRHARRSAVGDRLSDRADAEGARRAAAAGGRERRGARGLSAGRHARRGRSRGGQMVLGEQPAGRPRRRHACRARSGCSCRCAPGAARSASSASTATAPGRC